MGFTGSEYAKASPPLCAWSLALGKDDVLYFGVEQRNRPGHRYVSPSGGDTFEMEKKLPRFLNPRQGLIDGQYCIQTTNVEGRALIHFVQGWTVLSFWDRSGDSRGGSNSNFVVKGRHSFNDMVEITRALFPQIWARFNFDVTLADEDLGPETRQDD